MKKVLFASLITSLFFVESKAQQGSVVQKPLSSRANFKILGFEIEKSTLKEIRSKLGNAHVYETSHNGEAEESICYVSVSDNLTLVEFKTGVPGRRKDLIGFRVGTLEYESLRSKCSKSPVFDPIITESGLKLWMGKADIIARFGKPTSSSEEELTYRSEETRKPTPEELKAHKKASPSIDPETIEIPLITSMEFHFVSSKLVSFSIYQTATAEPDMLVRK
jgi:hypothetical protein